MNQQGEGGRQDLRVLLQFCRADRRYEPLAALRVRYEVEGLSDDQPRAVEHSVLWYTEGKGEEDMGVHFFERLTERASLPPEAAAGTFTTLLPPSPLSYEGVIVKIRWCARVRLFFSGGRDFVSEYVFEMGRIPPARPPRAGDA